MTTNRRDFIAGAGATLALSNLPSTTFAAGADADVEATLSGFAEELLVDYPESATGLGIDTGKRAGLKAKLPERSADRQKTIAARIAKRLEKLKAIDVSKLGDTTRINVDVMRTSHEFAAEGFKFPYGDSAVLNQSWAYRNAP